jgi:nicotinamidase-related amidase
LPVHGRILSRERVAILVIDLQDSYVGKLANEERVVHATQRLLQAAPVLGLPVLVTEQYPKGLGKTRAEIAEAAPPDAARFEKTTFSCLGAPGLREHLRSLGRDQILVCGIETHVCVSQTVHDLMIEGYQPHVVRDAITARFALEDETGYMKLLGSGAVAATTESALFEMLRDARAPEFKAVHRLVL